MMTRKWAGYAVIIYLLYIASMYGYLFFFADTSIPAALKGTAADPQTFLNARELVLSEEYSTIRNFIFFLNTPLEWLIYFFILLFGISRGFEKWSLSISRWKFVQQGFICSVCHSLHMWRYFLFNMLATGLVDPTILTRKLLVHG